MYVCTPTPTPRVHTRSLKNLKFGYHKITDHKVYISIWAFIYFIDKHHALLAAGYIAPLGGALVWGDATITWTNIIQYVSNFGNKNVPREFRSSLNMSEIGQLELGYLPLNFFNFSHFWGVATIIQTNIIRSVSNFGNMKVLRKYRSSSKMIEIGQPELGCLPLNFFWFSPFLRCWKLWK